MGDERGAHAGRQLGHQLGRGHLAVAGHHQGIDLGPGDDPEVDDGPAVVTRIGLGPDARTRGGGALVVVAEATLSAER